MRVLLCPISGGKFVNQLAGLHALLVSGYNPDTCIAASGGNVSICSLLYSNGDPNRMRILVSMLDYTLFVDSWLKPFPSWMIGPFQGAVYRHSTKFIDFGKDFFTPSVIQRKEVWILTFNQTVGKPHLFTNRNPVEYILQPNDQSIVQDITGNVETYFKAILASSSIPGLLPSLLIDNYMHTDGGVYAATPQILFTKKLRSQKNLHITSITAFNLDEYETKKAEDIIMITYNFTVDVVRNAKLQDRLLSLDILASYGKVSKMQDLTVEEGVKAQQKYKATLLEVYPITSVEMDVSSFTSLDLLEVYDRQINNIRCKLWYVL